MKQEHNKKYVFDKDSFDFRRDERKVKRTIAKILKLFIASVSLAVVYYLIFALFFNTETERKLKTENRSMEKMYPTLRQKADLLSDVVDGLRFRDDAIYEEFFNTAAPDVERLLSVDFMPLGDSLGSADIVLLTQAKADMLMSSAEQVDQNMMKVFGIFAGENFSMPPMSLPVEDFSLPMTGASVGKKVNPFYGVPTSHDGIDIMASLGDRVVSSADGIVSQVIKSRRGLGNVVEVDHGNGYRTRYAHLTDIVVGRGRKVSKGTLLGHVGMSGKSFAPHLHYEVIRDTVTVDPVNYFFASVDPYQYVNMLIMSVATGQSLD